MRVVVWPLSSPAQLPASVCPPFLLPPLPPPPPRPPVSAPKACCWPTEPPAGSGHDLCRSRGDTKGSSQSAAHSWSVTSSPGTGHRKCVCSGALVGSCPSSSRARGRRCTRRPHTEPWLNRTGRPGDERSKWLQKKILSKWQCWRGFSVVDAWSLSPKFWRK